MASGGYSTHDANRQPTPPNFLGYLNPEAVLREQVHHERGKTNQSPSIPSIGQWVDGHEAGRSPKSQPGQQKGRLDETTQQATTAQEAAVQRALHAYLDAVGVAIVPPREHQKALLNIYFTYVHPLLPIVDQNLFTKWYAEEREPRMLLQAICIVASKHAEAADHLLLGADPRVLRPRDFSQRLYNAVIAGIEAKLEKNRVILIQVLALISLHCEGPDGAEQASMHLAQAIHHAHTFGLQFGHQWKGQKSDSQENLEDLFWCLWSLDKINACMNGRPLLMHDRDNGLTKLPQDPEKRSSPFGVWLQIAEMLDRVIDFYRPGRSPEETGWETDDFLGFEEMVGDGEDKLDGPIMSLLSLFHHAMCMASHKSLSINDPVKATPSYTRQSLSATRVISLLNAEPPETLPPLPLVPYTLSLALSVVYRHFRCRRLKVHIKRATDELKQCVMLLNRLRNAWWSAGQMADLGTAVLNNADRNTRTANTPAVATEADHHHALFGSQPHDELVTEQKEQASIQAPHHAPPGPSSNHHRQWQQHHLDASIDPRLHSQVPRAHLASGLLNPLPTIMEVQHPTSSERSSDRPLTSLLSTPQNPTTNLLHNNTSTQQQQHQQLTIGPSVATSPAPSSAAAAATLDLDFSDPSPDEWLNFDNAFQNFSGLLGGSGADLSNELFRPLSYEMEDF
ncbi:uncharacterized protein EI97DRAFT_119348 [Westerdykella ornata]|uniref:Xylanolytic transcriptional activator regulatory domain-containing protein n=1 Tax=Westerdykella ornata TaxID=318751 RepID=A0A6A6JX65_WESOR|nr:uncharacterized protein EI97DRAFT_119348 [Westerdykella ornata]KAF2280326.1 hypothetical protein EI97DRAFT_119348 [Westerdykella ornata]